MPMPQDDNTPEPSLRDTISQSLDAADAGGVDAPAGGTPDTAPAGGDLYAAPQTQTPATTPAQGAPEQRSGTPARNPNGQFQSRQQQAAPTDPNAQQQPQQTAPTSKPPGTWTPQAREHWNTIPEEVRADIWRREKEVSRAMTQSVEARNFKGEFDKAVAPFMPLIAAAGSNPIQATVNMMQTAAALQTGPASQKAQLVAQIITQYGVDLRQLDAILAGQNPQAGGEMQAQDYIDRLIRERMTPYQTRLQKFEEQERAQAQALDDEVNNDVDAFAADPKNEFFMDVKDIMADLIEVADKQGRTLSLTDAYARATLLSEPVRQTLERRGQNQSAQRNAQIAQQARSNAFSVRPSAEAGTTQPVRGDSIRDAISFAMERNSGR